MTYNCRQPQLITRDKNIEINAAGAANEKLYRRRDTRASRGKRKPDIDTIESCVEFMKIYAMFYIYGYIFFEQTSNEIKMNRNLLLI